MTDRLIYRLATTDDNPAILELFQASFGRTMRADWWNWLSHQCPTGSNRTTVIEDPQLGRLAGSYSLLPIRLWMNGREVQASLCTNVNTHPEYRRMGLFTKIGRYALDQEEEFETPVSLGMPNQSALPGHLRLGWDAPFSLPFLVKKGCKVRRHACREVNSFDDRVGDLLARIRRKFSFLVMKDHRFLNWRVVDRPDQEYTKMVYEDGSELSGYVVLKHFEENGYRKSHILDLQAESEEGLLQLIAASESFSHGRDELNMWTNAHNPYRSSFLDQGFVQHESSDRLILHTNYGDGEKLQKGAWWFCLADNDVY